MFFFLSLSESDLHPLSSSCSGCLQVTLESSMDKPQMFYDHWWGSNIAGDDHYGPYTPVSFCLHSMTVSMLCADLYISVRQPGVIFSSQAGLHMQGCVGISWCWAPAQLLASTVNFFELTFIAQFPFSHDFFSVLYLGLHSLQRSTISSGKMQIRTGAHSF